jgi:hypothetical protein
MANWIQAIALEKLVAHPDNPNKQSRVNFTRLVRNIEQTGRYEPLIVRPCPDKAGADCIVWDIDDEQTDILLATLNRLGGTDQLSKKLKLLKRLNKRLNSGELAKLIPQNKKQIERLSSMLDSRCSILDSCKSQIANPNSKIFANPMVFFLDDEQQQIVENALSLAEQNNSVIVSKAGTKAARKAAALTTIAQHFLNNSPTNPRGSKND